MLTIISLLFYLLWKRIFFICLPTVWWHVFPLVLRSYFCIMDLSPLSDIWFVDVVLPYHCCSSHIAIFLHCARKFHIFSLFLSVLDTCAFTVVSRKSYQKPMPLSFREFIVLYLTLISLIHFELFIIFTAGMCWFCLFFF